MRRLIILATGLVLVLPAPGRADLCGDGAVPTIDDTCEGWARIYDNPNGHVRGGKDILFDEVASNDTVFVTGRSEDDTSGGYDAYTIAYDVATGAERWAARFHSGGSDSGNGIGLSPDATTVYVTGYHESSGLLTIAYDAATGAQRWQTRTETRYISTVGLRILSSPDGTRVYTAAYGIDGTDARDLVLVAQEAATGEVLFTGSWDGPASLKDEPIGLEIAPDGSRAYIAGISRGSGSATNDDYAVVAFDAGPTLEDGSLPATAGQVVWASRYNGPVSGLDAPTGFDMSPDGSRLFITGRSALSTPVTLGDQGLVTVAYDAPTGAKAWEAAFTGPVDGSHPGGGVAVSRDGRKVFVAGTVTSLASHFDSDIGVAAYDAATGALSWSRSYAVPGLIYEQGVDVAAGTSGPIVTGFSGDGVYKSDQVTISYDGASGAQRWVARYNDGHADRTFIRGVVVTPDGRHTIATSYTRRVLVAGFSCTSCNEYDYLTLAYDA